MSRILYFFYLRAKILDWTMCCVHKELVSTDPPPLPSFQYWNLHYKNWFWVGGVGFIQGQVDEGFENSKDYSDANLNIFFFRRNRGSGAACTNMTGCLYSERLVMNIDPIFHKKSFLFILSSSIINYLAKSKQFHNYFVFSNNFSATKTTASRLYLPSATKILGIH